MRMERGRQRGASEATDGGARPALDRVMVEFQLREAFPTGGDR